MDNEKQFRLFKGGKRKKTKSTKQAMKVLNAARKFVIVRGRSIAEAQIHRDGTTHSRKVRAEMAHKGLIDGKAKECWLGAIFRCADFAWAGGYHTYSDASRNIHERTVKLWKMAA